MTSDLDLVLSLTRLNMLVNLILAPNRKPHVGHVDNGHVDVDRAILAPLSFFLYCSTDLSP